MLKRILFNGSLRVVRAVVGRLRLARLMAQPGVKVGVNCVIGQSVKIGVSDGGSLEIGAGVGIGDFVEIRVRGGKICIGEDAQIGQGCVIVSQKSITIGCGSLIAEYVVIRDQDHDISTRPLVAGAFVTGSIDVGSDVWIGAKASVLRGTVIGAGAVIGAHAVVRGYVPPNALAVGVPARVVRRVASASASDSESA